jgi:hypothetical protein
MGHLYRISLNTRNSNFSVFKRYLKEKGLIKQILHSQLSLEESEESILVLVSNKRKFETYMKKKDSNRDRLDPHDAVLSYRYEGVDNKKTSAAKKSKRCYKSG